MYFVDAKPSYLIFPNQRGSKERRKHDKRGSKGERKSTDSKTSRDNTAELMSAYQRGPRLIDFDDQPARPRAPSAPATSLVRPASAKMDLLGDTSPIHDDTNNAMTRSEPGGERGALLRRGSNAGSTAITPPTTPHAYTQAGFTPIGDGRPPSVVSVRESESASVGKGDALRNSKKGSSEKRDEKGILRNSRDGPARKSKSGERQSGKKEGRDSKKAEGTRKHHRHHRRHKEGSKIIFLLLCLHASISHLPTFRQERGSG